MEIGVAARNGELQTENREFREELSRHKEQIQGMIIHNHHEEEISKQLRTHLHAAQSQVKILEERNAKLSYRVTTLLKKTRKSERAVGEAMLVLRKCNALQSSTCFDEVSQCSSTSKVSDG